MHRQSVVMQGDVHRKQSAPLCKENTAVARRESVALPLIEVVVVLQPLVQEVADVEFDQCANGHAFRTDVGCEEIRYRSESWRQENGAQEIRYRPRAHVP
jgi:hypothetical protein